MTGTWRDVALELAGPEALIREGVTDEQGYPVALEVDVPGMAIKLRGPVRRDPWRGVAYDLANLRLMQSLERAGWTVVEDVIDQATYVVAQEPGGTVWAIGVAAPNDDMRAYLERDMALDGRAERFAFVDPRDTRSAHDLMEALGFDDG